MGKFLLLVIFMACCALGSSTVEIKTSVLQNRGAISPRLQNPFLSTSALHCEGCGVDDAPGSPVNCEAEFFPTFPSRSLTLNLEACINAELCMQILRTELPNSSVLPGFTYSFKYTIIPNFPDGFTGYRFCILDTDSGVSHMCESYTCNPSGQA
ncbi:uncharacterized protein LOC110844674 [Folsomia candida]|uniref:Uncharacterized protein n=1 Tax=Folsomia candida TaxID=158441 RepID=A0A226ENH9_FOLCA|nr:uncharacterized protein LOC110844674 [Folsomia candida]OXA59203.1 hypothetical protein Fcan01_04698 [Folsomia candida]